MFFLDGINADLYNGKKLIKRKRKNAPGELVNSVGCGDSMVAGFVSGYITTGDYAEALRLATACANATAYSEGLAQRADIEKIIQNR